MLKLYVGCALTHAPKEFKDTVEELKAHLDGVFKVLRFLGLEKGTPEDVYRVDIIENVGTCNLMLAICDHPSIGLGVEIHEAVKVRQIPVLAVGHKDSKFTRLLVGMAGHYPNLKTATYEDMHKDVPPLLGKFVEEVREDMWDEGIGAPVWMRGRTLRS